MMLDEVELDEAEERGRSPRDLDKMASQWQGWGNFMKVEGGGQERRSEGWKRARIFKGRQEAVVVAKPTTSL